MTTKGNLKKKEQLGMPYGTAFAKLRKSILFDLTQKLGLDLCFRCNKKITTVKHFSIEHKKPWLDVDPKLFWDLENISFSHLTCNIGAARRFTIPSERNGLLWCWSCSEYLDAELFPPKGNTNSGGRRECTKCNSKYRSEYRKRTGKR